MTKCLICNKEQDIMLYPPFCEGHNKEQEDYCQEILTQRLPKRWDYTNGTIDKNGDITYNYTTSGGSNPVGATIDDQSVDVDELVMDGDYYNTPTIDVKKVSNIALTYNTGWYKLSWDLGKSNMSASGYVNDLVSHDSHCDIISQLIESLVNAYTVDVTYAVIKRLHEK